MALWSILNDLETLICTTLSTPDRILFLAYRKWCFFIIPWPLAPLVYTIVVRQHFLETVYTLSQLCMHVETSFWKRFWPLRCLDTVFFVSTGTKEPIQNAVYFDRIVVIFRRVTNKGLKFISYKFWRNRI